MRVPLENLWLIALFVIAVGTVLLVCVIKLKLAVAVVLAAVKVVIPMYYFLYPIANRWVLFDDLKYFLRTEQLFYDGVNPVSALLFSSERELLYLVAGGNHILYYWWNLLAMYLFGPFYSSAVFLNVAITFASAALLYKLARISGCHQRYATWLALFFLFHWDTLVWSSFVNLKDTLVVFLTLAAIYSSCQIAFHRKKSYGAYLLVVVLLFGWIRLYVPVLLFTAFCAWLFVAGRLKLKFLWGALGVMVVLLLFPRNVYELFMAYTNVGTLVGPFAGMVKMMLTPQPWSVSHAYSYLRIPALLHWLFFLPAIVGGVSLIRRNLIFRFAAIYAVLILVVFSLMEELQGPRQRVQISWVFIWAQFEFLWLVVENLVVRRSARRRVGSARAESAGETVVA